ncbi:nucleotidyl transferase AbiEii/AbiGii toxin family protein [Candidatus Dependentiae bacterium]|nr:nucleotidyl transferase AbiEii/AbiGii toxin family protein [Candidatus Dependentiae bacterium]
MIPRNYILEWTENVPWGNLQQVEQDLLLTTMLLKLYTHPILKETLAFRGGTALNKLIFKPASRYSEDIDLVQITTGPIGPTLTIIREIMDPLLGKPTYDGTKAGATLTYKTTSEEGLVLRLKLEINTREHFSILGFQDYEFVSTSSWHSGTALVRSYRIEELLGTKLRALYQRRKGRDLYDLYTALTTIDGLNKDEIIRCFLEYMRYEQRAISQESFLSNMEAKLKNKEFREDIAPLLPRHILTFDPDAAYEQVRQHLLEKL